jgi:hypothetical protein
MNRDIFQAVSELTLIIGAFWHSCKTDPGRETWYCRVPAIVEKWLPLSEDFAPRRSDAEGGLWLSTFPYGLPLLRRAYTQHDFAQHKGATHG